MTSAPAPVVMLKDPALDEVKLNAPVPPVIVVDVAVDSPCRLIAPVEVDASMVKAAAKSESTILRSPVPLIFNVLTAVATSEPIVFDPLTPEPVAVISAVSAVDKVKMPTCPLALMPIF